MTNRKIYEEALQTAQSEMEELLEERAKIETRLEDIKERIDSLRKSISGLRAVLGEAYDADEETGVTDAIRALLESSRSPLSAIDIREGLRGDGFPVDAYKQPLAVIHTTLKRLEEQNEVEAQRKDGKTCYRIFRIKRIQFDN